MGHQYIKQPNGKFAIWSSIETDFVAWDCTEDEVVEFEIEEAIEQIKEQVKDRLSRVAGGTSAYYQFTKTWEEALKRRDELHGKGSREFDDQGNVLLSWVVEAWVDGGPVGSIEAYWAPGNVEMRKPGTLVDDWTDWTGDPRKAKRFSSKEETEREIVLIKEKRMEWSSNMQPFQFRFK